MFENVDQRNADFMKAVEAVSESLAAHGRGMTVRQIVGIALLQRPRSFYVTGEYALRRLRAMIAGNAPGEPKAERRMMWCELLLAYTERRRKRPREDERMAIGWVLDNVAPSQFFISRLYAEKLLYSLLRKRRRENRLRMSATKAAYAAYA